MTAIIRSESEIWREQQAAKGKVMADSKTDAGGVSLLELKRELRISSDFDHRSWEDIKHAFAALTSPPSSGVQEALEELCDLMEAVVEGAYKPDSFTTQPARIALSQLPTTDEARTGALTDPTATTRVRSHDRG